MSTFIFFIISTLIRLWTLYCTAVWSKVLFEGAELYRS